MRRGAGFPPGAAASRRSVIASLAAGVFLAAFGRRAEAGDAEGTAADFLAGIYDSYREGGQGIVLDEPKLYGRYFTPGLTKLMQADRAAADAAGEVPALDSDPFTDSQDGEITGIRVSVKDAGPDKATGLVRFHNIGDPVSITLKLVRTSAGWRIDDIVWAEGTLRSLYPN